VSILILTGILVSSLVELLLIFSIGWIFPGQKSW